MAERRMFAKTIVLSDAFLDMPMSARCLYFTLGMLADDDGFVNSPRSIMRQCGASDDDMKILISKKFVIIFENGVIVIKHWRINNYLRADRYTTTKYQDEKATLSVDDQGIYHHGTPSGIPTGIPAVYHPVDERYTQVRLCKDRLDKVSLEQDRIVKGECEGGTQPPTPTAPAEQPPMLTAEQKKERIDFYVERIKTFKRLGFVDTCLYTLAESEGISRVEVESALRSDTGGKADGNERSV